MRTFLRSNFKLLTIVFGLLLAIPAIALADIVDSDADLVTPGNQAGTNSTPIDMGTVKPGGTITKQVSFQLRCNGNNHVDENQTVNLTFQTASGLSAGQGTASATGTTIGPIPASWPNDGSGCGSTPPTPREDNGNSTVSYTAPSTAANGDSYNFSVRWNNG